MLPKLPKLFLPEVSSAATRPVCRTSNAEIKIFDNIFFLLKRIVGPVTSVLGMFLELSREVVERGSLNPWMGKRPYIPNIPSPGFSFHNAKKIRTSEPNTAPPFFFPGLFHAAKTLGGVFPSWPAQDVWASLTLLRVSLLLQVSMFAYIPINNIL